MRTDDHPAPGPFDTGLLSPVSAGRDDLAGDAAVLAALVEAEVGILRALAHEGIAPAAAGEKAGALRDIVIDPRELAEAGVAGGNPVIPLVKQLRAGSDDDVSSWIHTGATSQDIVDTALMIVGRDAGARVLEDLRRVDLALEALARAHDDLVAAGRTLTQHAVPTTVGHRAETWRHGVSRAIVALDRAIAQLPAQFGGAGGTMAALVDRLRRDGVDDPVARTQRVRAAFADAVHLARTADPWHTSRWPVTELGDALAQAIAALGRLATDVATGSRTEIGELAEPTGGGSSAMPQKRNPARSVLIRSAAIRAPQLAATLQVAAGLFADERADGAWHAEWPALRELLRLALGASSHAADLAEGLQVDADAVARNLAATGGLIVSERIGAVLGTQAAADIVARAADGSDLRALVAEALAAKGASIGVDELLDPAAYLGIAAPRDT